ncbi:MAG: hypothetical protein ABJ081_05205 [Hyphomicrobiales bacterium]
MASTMGSPARVTHADQSGHLDAQTGQPNRGLALWPHIETTQPVKGLSHLDIERAPTVTTLLAGGR